jgi:hypothetical protein
VNPAKVFLAVPYYQQFPGECVDNHDAPCSEKHECVVHRRGEAFVDRCFSSCWAAALNSRPWTHFGMVHVDVSPPKLYLDHMLALMDRSGADLLSVVLPVKTMHGYTSTALMSPDGRWRRLTMHEVAELPEVFDAESAGFPGCRLLASTGLWIARFDQQWTEEVWFETKCRIVRRGEEFVVKSFPEDWHFSMLLHSMGLRVMSTRAVKCDHWGMAPYPNDRAWGSVKSDAWHEV